MQPRSHADARKGGGREEMGKRERQGIFFIVTRMQKKTRQFLENLIFFFAFASSSAVRTDVTVDQRLSADSTRMWRWAVARAGRL